jgi:hypothetical protein
MKLIIRDYLASLKERGELDAILPDLLSELGYIVYSRPGRGTTQLGVDIAAIGFDEDGVKKVFLFSVKQGDLNRQDWDGNPQALRASLNEILDAYIPSRIPKKYEGLGVVICLCFGGDILEQVRPAVTGYIKQHSSDKLSFEEWNGDKIADLLLRGILREEILPKPLRSSFQKAVAMVDEPDISYRHFADLVEKLRAVSPSDQVSSVRSARQIYICLWILFVWARGVDNVEAPYRASELAILNVWFLLRPFINKKNSNARAMNAVLNQLVHLHLSVCSELLERKILPHVDKLHALSTAMESRSYTDVNLKLFEFLGRIAMTGLWFQWLTELEEKESSQKLKLLSSWMQRGFDLIKSNPALYSPLCDRHAIEISLFLLLTASDESKHGEIRHWLAEMVNRIDFSVRSHGKYPSTHSQYRELINHPRERTSEYRREVTAGSTLIPLLAIWLKAANDSSAFSKLDELVRAELGHCTLQFWVPDEKTEGQIYLGERDNGIALCDLPLSSGETTLIDRLHDLCQKHRSFYELSANKTGHWPIILLACRHYKTPVPPHYWINFLRE